MKTKQLFLRCVAELGIEGAQELLNQLSLIVEEAPKPKPKHKKIVLGDSSTVVQLANKIKACAGRRGRGVDPNSMVQRGLRFTLQHLRKNGPTARRVLVKEIAKELQIGEYQSNNALVNVYAIGRRQGLITAQSGIWSVSNAKLKAA